MSQIRGKNTKPERIVRSIAHNLGFKFRLHNKGLPGKPDLVFASNKKIIFVHGCYWHRHSCLKGKSIPATNIDFWKQKLQRNKERDKSNKRALSKAGWSVLTVWECQLKKHEKIINRIENFINK